MIQKLIIKLVVPLIKEMFFKMFDEQAKIYKFKNTLDYMELPNDLDKGLVKAKEEIAMLKESLKSIEKDAHPPAIDLKEWNEVKDLMKKFKKIRSL